MSGKEISDDIFDWFKCLPKVPKWTRCRGVEYHSKCICGGTITAVRSKYNGHIHITCDKCDRQLHE